MGFRKAEQVTKPQGVKILQSCDANTEMWWANRSLLDQERGMGMGGQAQSADYTKSQNHRRALSVLGMAESFGKRVQCLGER